MRLSYGSAGGLLGALSDQVPKPMVARNLERTLHNLSLELGEKEERTR
jgi:hypothetical protein